MRAMTEPTRVFLLDDHEVVRRGLRDLLEAEDDLEVVGEAGTAEEAVGRIPATSPTSPCSTCGCPTATGSRCAARSARGTPRSPASCSRRSPTTRRCTPRSWRGPPGYVLKQVRGTDLVDGIRRVARGESLLDPVVTTRVLERLRHSEADDELAGLTDQERKILELIAEGLTNRQIGEQMFLAEKTVKNYVSNLLSKLGMSRRTEAAAYAARLAERKQRSTGD